jgi:hypothetical protein
MKLNIKDFPYTSFTEASKDNFSKLTTRDYPRGGKDAAFYYMVKCWIQDGHRKKSQMKAQAKREKMTVKAGQEAARRGITIEEYLELEA